MPLYVRNILVENWSSPVNSDLRNSLFSSWFKIEASKILEALGTSKRARPDPCNQARSSFVMALDLTIDKLTTIAGTNDFLFVVGPASFHFRRIITLIPSSLMSMTVRQREDAIP